uniref:hypothetical protein n=1 Tax=Mycobacterium tuberculosis TaxID=1773 RepID=UPI003C6D1B55
MNRIDVDGAQVHGFAEMHEVGLRNQRADREAEVEQALVVARPEGAVAVVTGDEGAGVDVAGVGHPGV